MVHSRGTTRLPATEVHDVLRNERRRLVLQRLQEQRTAQSVRDLAEYIATVESGEDPPPRNLRQSVYVSLHQTHLPKLDDLNIVEYDNDAKEVDLGEHAEDVAVYLEVVPRYGLTSNEFYLALAVIGGLLVVGSLLGVPIVAGLGPGTWAMVLLGVIGAVAGYFTVRRHGAVVDPR